MQVWASYLSLLDTDPLKTRMATSFVISVLGDLLAQSLEGVDIKVHICTPQHILVSRNYSNTPTSPLRDVLSMFVVVVVVVVVVSRWKWRKIQLVIEYVTYDPTTNEYKPDV